MTLRTEVFVFSLPMVWKLWWKMSGVLAFVSDCINLVCWLSAGLSVLVMAFGLVAYPFVEVVVSWTIFFVFSSETV
ncbi:hypothetical protein BDA96_09G144400 [Sorghum bicolor]|uniref:Uncharacterized protein n=2 Tax=Sorghum bicolor TaxID=4558 RepID=A0A1Z5R2L9_SORBI|nr:hypothetical protein BDA96_09G144400 [Sorghum bicolor]OQU78007.1 hypothetical protein SORBI_3009G136950 [Sorghum bicolor]